MGSKGARGIARLVGMTSLALAPMRAAAADPPLDTQAARELFARAEADEDAGRWDAALEKMQRVLAAKDTAGVRYHVALCEERLGKLAAAQADYVAADTKARADRAQDVLRLVGKRLSSLDGRVPHVTVRIEPTDAGAALTIDGRIATPGAASAVDPGAHEIEVLPSDHRAPALVPFSIEVGESRTIDVALPPVVAAPAPANGPASPNVAPGGEPPLRVQAPPRTGALLETAGALLLAGGGAAAYLAAGASREQGARSCALVTTTAACDAYRAPVRAWDWVAIGAWVGAGAVATWAVVSWTHPLPARVRVGAGGVGLEGAF